MKILIVEDNTDIAANIGDYLEDNGHVVDYAHDGISGLRMAKAEKFDVMILDLMLPGMDGLEVCRLLKEENNNTPILMLTARDRLDDKLMGFSVGADDYLIKPFELAELEARIQVLGRRNKPITPRVLEVADLKFNLDTLHVSRADKTIDLNPTAMKLLRKLMESSPWVVSREDIENHVWGDELPDSDSLRVHIHSLRQAIDKPFDKPLIHTKHGIGYRIADPDEL